MNETNTTAAALEAKHEPEGPTPASQLYVALARAQASMAPVPKSKVNSHLGSKFADLSAIFEAARRALTDNGISWTQKPLTDPTGNGVTIVTTLHHGASGESDSCELWLPVPQRSAQAYGSAITYGKKYTFAALVGLASADEDDDGEGASPSSRGESPQARSNARSPSKAPPAREPKPAASEPAGEPVQVLKFKKPGEPGGPGALDQAEPAAPLPELPADAPQRVRLERMIATARSYADAKAVSDYAKQHEKELTDADRDALKPQFVRLFQLYTGPKATRASGKR